MYLNVSLIMEEKKVSHLWLAKEIGISEDKLLAKLDGDMAFTFHEAKTIKNLLNVDMPIEELFYKVKEENIIAKIMMTKKGLDYFGINVNIHRNVKMRYLKANYGLKGEAIFIRLLCDIYEKGYYMDWNDDIALLFVSDIGGDCDVITCQNIVDELLLRNIFDKDMFNRYQILTSKGIQNRFLEASIRRKSVDFIEEYLLVEIPTTYAERVNVDILSLNVDIIDENVDISGKNVDISKQSKVKKSKVKQSKVKQSREKETLILANSASYLKLWNDKCYLKPIKSITEKRAGLLAVLFREHGENSFVEVIEAINNSPFLKGQKGFVATFDWVIKPNNYIKILEGNFADGHGVTEVTRRIDGNSAAKGTGSETKRELYGTNL